MNAYNEGKEAAKAGKDLIDNPYEAGEEFEMWLDGFFDFLLDTCVMSA